MLILVTSKRYQKEVDALRRLKNGIKKGRSELRRFGSEEARIPKGLEEEVLPQKECLECRVCGRVSVSVEPRIIEGVEFVRLRSLAVPQLPLCNLCAKRIDQEELGVADYLGGELAVRGRIKTRVIERETDRGLSRRRRLELVAGRVEEDDPYRLLKARLGRRSLH